MQWAQTTRLVPGGRIVIDAFEGPRLIILLLKRKLQKYQSTFMTIAETLLPGSI